MNNQKGFSLVELVVVIAILGVFGTAIFGLFVTGTRSYREVGVDSDIQNEAQLTINQIENLVIDTSRALTYSYTAGGTTTRALSDEGVDGITNKTLTVYNANEMYIIEWSDSDKKIYLQRNQLDDVGTGTIVDTGDRVEMAEDVKEFSVSLEKASSDNKVFIDIVFESKDGRKGYTTSKQVTLRNTLSINDVSTAYDEPQIPSTVSEVRIYHDDVDVSESTVGYFKHADEELSFLFSALVIGENYPINDVTWSVDVDPENGTSISDAGRLTIGENEDLSNAIRVIATSKQDANYSRWVNVLIKQITGITVEIDNASRKEAYNYGDVITVKASIAGRNLDLADKTFVWTANGAQRLATYGPNSEIQEYKITGDVGDNFKITATSAADSSYFAYVEQEISNPYSISIAWDGTPSDMLLRKGTTNNIKATVTPNSGNYGNVRWEICYIQNRTTGADVTAALKSTNARDDKISLTSSFGNTTSIYCGKDVDWNSKFTVGVRAYLNLNGHIIYSEPIYINMDDVFIRVWYGYKSADLRTNDESRGLVEWVNANSGVSYNYGLYGYANTLGTVIPVSASNDYVLGLGYNENTVWFTSGSKSNRNGSIHNAKFKFQIDGKTWGYIHNYINY